ncbi:MAG: iron-sulfur cluster assembly accessory protein [Verrucomicrobiae bacterium]|nr:iron-sulfur cluster assembly accessory protein [Verrucomicrobiae bacterium]
MITLTPHATEQVRSLVAGKPGAALRISVEKGGCSGMQYAMSVDQARPGDVVVGESGGRIVLDPKALPFVDGCEIDYVDGLTGAGFKVSNPNAKRSCGCGTSFET